MPIDANGNWDCNISPAPHAFPDSSCVCEVEGPASTPPAPTAYWKLDEASGDRIDEVQGIFLGGAQVGSVDSVAGKIGPGVSFPVSGAGNLFLRTPNDADPEHLVLQPTNGFTFCFWFRLDTANPGSSFYLNYFVYDSDDNELDIAILRFQENTTAYITSDSYTPASTPFVAVPGQWYFVRFWYDPSGDGSLNFQIDNGDKFSIGPPFTYVFPDPPAAVAWGYLTIQQLDTTGAYSIDELAFFDRALTDDEAALLYNSGNGVTYPYT